MAALTKKGVRNRASKSSRTASSSSGNLESSLAPGPFWASFEKLRVQGATALSRIKPGVVGTLTSQGQQFRLLHESDFQQLVGLARETDRTRRGLRVIHAAVRTVQKHPDKSSVDTLVEAALLLESSPVLPTRQRFAAMQPETEEGIDLMPEDGEDEVEINPEFVRRPLTTQSQASEGNAESNANA